LERAVADARRDPRGGKVVVDGLFAAATGRPLPTDTIALLHTVPATETWSATPLRAIVTSAPTADAVRTKCRDVTIVRPGLDACFVPHDPAPRAAVLRAVCVGTVSPAKGQRLVARALAALAERGVPSELALVGDTASHPYEVARVLAAAGPVAVRVLGALAPARVADELNAADVFVSASRSESFGMAAAEAAACGTPVFAFAAGEIATFVHDRGNGWLVPANSDDGTFIRRLVETLVAPNAVARARSMRSRPPLTGWDEVAGAFAAACRAAD
ncbi:MAG: glycosyltransferase, partial [Planctomycetes bacterium]|nr:glycosyltransferase [Planctomycetota bacterium]